MDTIPTSLTLRCAAAAVDGVDTQSRTISGLAVPYGPVGRSSAGAITFAHGALELPERIGRVKLLKQHDPERSLGFATALDDRQDGLYATFEVADGPDGDLALAEAADGRRDGLSVGVQLSDASVEELWRKRFEDDNSPTAVSGRLLEVSQVSLPAFDDARADGSVAAAHDTTLTLAVSFAQPDQKGPTMDTDTITPDAVASTVEQDAPAAAPRAAAGGAVVASQAPVYTFDGRGPSFVRDVYHARFSGDQDAMGRLAEFNTRMLAGDESQLRRVTAAVETRTTAPTWIQQGYRPDLLVDVIDKGRPLVSRIGTVNLADATPYRLPVEGEMTGGVGDHTEGTAHVGEGDLAIGDVTVTPGAISGAYRLSRELIDASNPALDRIALNAMLRQYRYATEAKVAAALAAAAGAAVVSINTVQKLRGQLNDYYDLMLEDASGVAAHPGFYSALLADVDTAGRPMLASVNPSNAAGTPKSGHTGADIDGVEVFKAYSVTANDAFLYRAEDVHVGESSVQTFRFDEVEGPGVIKLALWSYFAAKVTRVGSVVKITSAATD